VATLISPQPSALSPQPELSPEFDALAVLVSELSCRAFAGQTLDDLRHDAFVAAANVLRSGTRPKNLRGLVLTVANRCRINAWRRARRCTSALDASLIESRASATHALGLNLYSRLETLRPDLQSRLGPAQIRIVDSILTGRPSASRLSRQLGIHTPQLHAKVAGIQKKIRKLEKTHPPPATSEMDSEDTPTP
jgi:hypothetical protein